MHATHAANITRTYCSWAKMARSGLPTTGTLPDPTVPFGSTGPPPGAPPPEDAMVKVHGQAGALEDTDVLLEEVRVEEA